MSTCEACGGDGLIEVGAYRGDEMDTATRECRLCGGAVTTTGYVFAREQEESTDTLIRLSSFGTAAVYAAEELQRLAATSLVHRSSESGKRTVDTVIQSALTPADIAAEYTARLNAENERSQREAEHRIDSSVLCGRESHA